MEMRLIVLSGAKHGTVIPLRKPEFTIGRAQECTLRAGSDAISRRHCKISRSEAGWQVCDLGSRNGTHINDEKISGEIELTDQDVLRVGPLQFRVELIRDKEIVGEKPSSSGAPEVAQPSSPTVETPVNSAQTMDDVAAGESPPTSTGIANDKTVEAANADELISSAGRATIDEAEMSGEAEEDISRWLLGDPNDNSATQETQAIRMEDTARLDAGPENVDDSPADAAADASDSAEEETAEHEDGDSEGDDDAKRSWSLFGRGGGKEKPKPKKGSPGKLPERPGNSTKDSREAAANVLREMTRRR